MIIGIVGGMGSGKTLVMSKLLYDDFKQNKSILSNYDLNFKHEIITPEIIKQYAEQEISLDNASIGLDEIYLYIDSRNSHAKRNKLYSYFMLQTNKRSVNLYFTAQSWHTVDKRFRDNTNVLYQVIPLFKDKNGEFKPNLNYSSRLIEKSKQNDFYIGITKTTRLYIGAQTKLFTQKMTIKAKEMFDLYDTKQIIRFS